MKIICFAKFHTQKKTFRILNLAFDYVKVKGKSMPMRGKGNVSMVCFMYLFSMNMNSKNSIINY